MRHLTLVIRLHGLKFSLTVMAATLFSAVGIVLVRMVIKGISFADALQSVLYDWTWASGGVGGAVGYVIYYVRQYTQGERTDNS
ncbi:MAG: hypothetical protein QXI60_04555 [Thermofilaceae archaeon]